MKGGRRVGDVGGSVAEHGQRSREQIIRRILHEEVKAVIRRARADPLRKRRSEHNCSVSDNDLAAGDIPQTCRIVFGRGHHALAIRAERRASYRRLVAFQDGDLDRKSVV